MAMEVAARTALQTKWTDGEKNALPRRGEGESWIGIYNEFLKLFRYPLQFDKLAGGGFSHISNSTHSVEEDKTRVRPNGRDIGAAICSNIMRAGKHTVLFQVNEYDDPASSYGILCGIMRPTTKDITRFGHCFILSHDLSSFSLKDYGRLHGDKNVDCCLLNTCTGNALIRKRWKEWEESELLAMDEEQREQAERQNRCIPFDWKGKEETQETSFKIGMVLDLDEGTLDVYKNDRRLGTMMSGVIGEYCWVVTFESTSVEGLVSIGR